MTTHRSSVGRVPTHGAAPAGRNLRSLANPSQFKAPSGAWAFDGSKTYKDFAPRGLLAVDSAGVGVISTPLRKPSPPAPLPSDGRGWRHLVAEGRRQNAEGGSPNGEAGAARGHYGKPKLINPERGTRSTRNTANAECGTRKPKRGGGRCARPLRKAETPKPRKGDGKAPGTSQMRNARPP
jgi:hypothetical protein